MKIRGSLLYAQSGGVTAVINATAAAVIEAGRAHDIKVLAARNGILGALREELIDTSKIRKADLKALAHTPGGAFGSCRYKLKSPDQKKGGQSHFPGDGVQAHQGVAKSDSDPLFLDPLFSRLIEVFRVHDIRWFLYNGGNDSADTALKLSQIGKRMGYDITCVGVPKTVDNDLAVTDCCPGFGSVAKYTAVSVREASLDIESMADTSTKVFIMEVMGRNAGWIAAAAGLAGEGRDQAPHLILFPERVFDEGAFLARVRSVVERVGYCTVVASEGIKGANGKLLAEAGSRDSFGHVQLGGVAPALAALIKNKLNLKCHWAVPDYLQRSARHIASATDFEQALAVGKAGVEYALAGMNAVMPVVVRTSETPYRWKIVPAALTRIANREKKLPKSFLRADGYGISAAARRYLAPLIHGEATPPFGTDGLPRYATLAHVMEPQMLPAWSETS